MRNTLLVIFGWLSLLVTLPWLQWFLAGEPYMKALGSYGAGLFVVWRILAELRHAARKKSGQLSSGDQHEHQT